MKKKTKIIIMSMSGLFILICTVAFIFIWVDKTSTKEKRYPNFVWNYEHTPIIVSQVIENQEKVKNILEPWDRFLNSIDLSGLEPSIWMEDGEIVTNYDIDISIFYDSFFELFEIIDIYEIVVTEDAIFIDFSPSEGLRASVVFLEHLYEDEANYYTSLGGNWFYFDMLETDFFGD